MSLDISYSGGVFSAPQAKSVGTVTAGTGPYNLSGASYDNKSFHVGSDSSIPLGLNASYDGTKFYIADNGGDNIDQYNLSTAWDISTASYANKTLSVSSQDTTPLTVALNSDGTTMFLLGAANNSIYQYSLSTAWDISTGSYDSVTFSLTTQSTGVSSFFVVSDGTKLFVSTHSSGVAVVYQYSLSTAWDLSTISYDSKSFSVYSQESTPRGISLNSDGTKLFILGNQNDTVYQYSLSTAYDISTASYDSVSFSVSSQADNQYGILFKPDGTKMYTVAITNDRIYQYSTVSATTLDLSTGNYFSHTPSVNTLFAFSNPPASGTAAGFALALTGANVGETYDIANASYDSVSFSVATQDASPFDIQFKTDGTKFYIIGSSNDAIFQYSLSTAWDVSTASYESKSLSVSGQETSPYSLRFKNDGTSVYVLGQGTDTIYQYDLTTAWDISTGSYASKSFSVASQDTAARALHFKSDGTKVYMGGQTNDIVYQYSLSTAWDISTASYDSVFFSFASQTTNPTALFFKPDGTEMFILGGFTFASVYKYTLSTAWDLSTASYSSISFSVSSQDTSPFGIDFKYDDGLKMYISGAANDTVYQYSTQATSTATFTYPSSVKFPSGTAPAGPAIGETDVLVFYTDDGGTTYQGFRAGDAMA